MGINSFNIPSGIPADEVTGQQKAELAKYVAPAMSGGNGNAEIGTAVMLGDALDEVPLFAGLSLSALVGGGGPDAGAWVEGKPIAELVAMGAQPGEDYFLHFRFPRSQRQDIHNVAGILLHFAKGWEAGVSSLLSELGYDGNDYLNVVGEIPAVQAAIKSEAAQLFGPFKGATPPAPDPFDPPVGLPTPDRFPAD